MRQILPLPADLADGGAAADLLLRERREHDDPTRPWVYSNMVTSIDGAATKAGRSGGLGGAEDRALFSALRATADVVLVGAETVRAEGYRLVREPDEAAMAVRSASGQGERARLCVVTRQRTVVAAPFLDEMPDDLDAAEPWQRPLLATSADDPDHRFDVIAAPHAEGTLDLRSVVTELGRHGLRRILCEGGPSLLGQLAALGLVDEWNFTIGAVVVSGDSQRTVHAHAAIDAPLRLERLLEHDSVLFARYLTA